MDKNKKYIIIIVLIVIILGGIIIFEHNKRINYNTLYCKMESKDNTMEIYYDFIDGEVYRYTNVISGNISDIDTDIYSTYIDAEGSINGVITKLDISGDTYTVYEIFDLNVVSEEDFQNITGMSLSDLLSMSRSDIKKTNITMSDSDSSYSCN